MVAVRCTLLVVGSLNRLVRERTQAGTEFLVLVDSLNAGQSSWRIRPIKRARPSLIDHSPLGAVERVSFPSQGQRPDRGVDQNVHRAFGFPSTFVVLVFLVRDLPEERENLLLLVALNVLFQRGVHGFALGAMLSQFLGLLEQAVIDGEVGGLGAVQFSVTSPQWLLLHMLTCRSQHIHQHRTICS